MRTLGTTLGALALGLALTAPPAAAQGCIVFTSFPTHVLPQGVLNVAYSETFGAFSLCSFSTSFTWAVTYGTLPAGLTLSTAGTLAGTPTAAGTSNFEIQVTDGAGNVLGAVFTLTVLATAPPTITTSTTLPAGPAGQAYSQSLGASGGSPPYTWSVTGGALPAGLALSAGGALTGTPATAGSYNFTVQVQDSVGATASATFSLTITQACTFSLYPGGEAFVVAGGTGAISITAAAGCQWTATSALSWVTLTGTSSGSGNGTVTYQVTANAGAMQTGNLTVAGLPFTVEQASETVKGLAAAGSMSQLASGGLWNTTITLVNTGATAAEMFLNFFDDNGNALLLPMTFPQNATYTSAAPLLASTLDRTIAPGAQIVIQTTGVSSQTVVAGWAQVLANGTIDGSAVYVEATATGTQEAVVPVETRNPSAFVLPFNYTNGYQTGIALANLSSQTAVIPVTLRDATGKTLLATTFPLAAYAHTSFMLADKYAVVGGQYGSMELDTPLGGQISVLGIRAAPNNAITTVPVVAAGAASNGSMTQLVSGGIWNVGIALVNTSSATAQVNLNFFDNNGAPLALPLLYPLTGTTSTTSQVTQSLTPDAQLVIQTTGASSQPTAVGWAQVVVTGGNVGGAAVYAEASPLGLQEASVTVETRNPTAFILPFNYTNGYLTGIAVANLTNQQVSIPVVLRDDTGAILGGAAASISLSANGHTSFMLADNYSVVANHYGTLELDTPAGGQISALGIRATPAGAITSVPVLAK